MQEQPRHQTHTDNGSGATNHEACDSDGQRAGQSEEEEAATNETTEETEVDATQLLAMAVSENFPAVTDVFREWLAGRGAAAARQADRQYQVARHQTSLQHELAMKDRQLGHDAFVFASTRVWRMRTVGLAVVIVATTALSLTDGLNNGATGILGAIAGYLFGKGVSERD